MTIAALFASLPAETDEGRRENERLGQELQRQYSEALAREFDRTVFYGTLDPESPAGQAHREAYPEAARKFRA